MIKRVSTVGMTREEWLAQRRKSIGGSDAGAVLGLNPYTSPYALWTEKTGKLVPEDISDRESVRLGNDLEDYVAQRWTERTGKKLRRDNNFVYNDEHPYAHVLVDRLVIGEKAGFEAKTTSSWERARQLKNGNLPEEWYCQCVHGMMVTGLERWYLGALAFGVGFFDFVIERNGEEITALAAAERTFWDGVTSNTPPALDGTEATSEALETIFADSNPGTSIDLTPCAEAIELLRDTKVRLKQLEFIESDAKAAIMQYMGSSERGIHPIASVSWKSGKRCTFDRAALMEEHPEIDYTRYIKETPSRNFRITFKEEK